MANDLVPHVQYYLDSADQIPLTVYSMRFDVVAAPLIR